MLAGSKSSVNKRLEERNVWQGLRAHMVCWKDSTPGTYRPSGPLLNDGFSAIRVSAGICVRVHRTARALAAPKALLASPHNRQRPPSAGRPARSACARLFDFCLSLQNSGAASSLLKISTPGQDTREPLLHSFLEDVSEYEPGEARTARPGDGTGMGGCRRGRREEGALHGLLGGPVYCCTRSIFCARLGLPFLTASLTIHGERKPASTP